MTVIEVKYERLGDHVHARFFAGTDSALLGNLVMDVGEWQLMGCALLMGSRQMEGHLTVVTEGSLEGKEVMA